MRGPDSIEASRRLVGQAKSLSTFTLKPPRHRARPKSARTGKITSALRDSLAARVRALGRDFQERQKQPDPPAPQKPSDPEIEWDPEEKAADLERVGKLIGSTYPRFVEDMVRQLLKAGSPGGKYDETLAKFLLSVVEAPSQGINSKRCSRPRWP